MRYGRWCVVPLVVLCYCPSAAAQGWGREFFEKLSGPGSFKGLGVRFPVSCLWREEGNKTHYWYFQTPEASERLAKESNHRLLCVDAGYASLSNQDREDAGLINIRLVEGNIILPVLEWADALRDRAFIEGVVGVGAMRFQGSDFHEWRFTFSPRVVLKPLKLIPARDRVNPNKRYDWRDILQFPLGAIWIGPKVTNDDLHAFGFEDFEHGWLKRANYVFIDLSQFVGLR